MARMAEQQLTAFRHYSCLARFTAAVLACSLAWRCDTTRAHGLARNLQVDPAEVPARPNDHGVPSQQDAVVRRIRSGRELPGALADTSVSTILLAQDIVLMERDWLACCAAGPLVVNRTLTLATDPSLALPAVVDVNSVTDKIQMLPGVEVYLDGVLFKNFDVTYLRMEPRFILFAASPPPGAGQRRPVLVVRGGGGVYKTCLPVELEQRAHAAIPRPPEFPGAQVLGGANAQLSCSNATSVHPFHRCYAQRFTVVDTAVVAFGADAVGKPVAQNYVARSVETDVMCRSVVIQACLLARNRSVAGCFVEAVAAVEAADAAAAAAEAATMAAAATGSGGAPPPLVVALPVALGGAACTLVVAAAVAWRKRRRAWAVPCPCCKLIPEAGDLQQHTNPAAAEVERPAGEEPALHDGAAGQHEPSQRDMLLLDTVTSSAAVNGADQRPKDCAAACSPEMATITTTDLLLVTPQTPLLPHVRFNLRLGVEVLAHEDRLRGAGACGRVVEGALEGRRVALKIMHASLERAATLRAEVEVLSRCSHGNIVTLYGVGCMEQQPLFLVMELMGQSLHHLMDSAPKRQLPLNQVLQIAADIARGLAYLHPTVTHRDLKPANVLLDSNGTAKLGDFGLARLRETVRVTHTEAGTTAYMAPECFNSKDRVITHKADIYSWAVLVWEMLSGQVPWQGMTPLAIVFRVVLYRARPPLEAVAPASRCPLKLRQLLQECWDQDPYRRPSAEEILKRIYLITDAPQQQHQHPAGAASSTQDDAVVGGALQAAAAAAAAGESADARWRPHWPEPGFGEGPLVVWSPPPAAIRVSDAHVVWRVQAQEEEASCYLLSLGGINHDNHAAGGGGYNFVAINAGNGTGSNDFGGVSHGDMAPLELGVPQAIRSEPGAAAADAGGSGSSPAGAAVKGGERSVQSS